MIKTVSILAPGVMGASIGKRLTSHGLKVLTVTAGRSEATARRAADAGMMPSSLAEVVATDLILGIVPPGDAVALAEDVASAARAAGRTPIYVDCNAINPQTVSVIAARMDGTCRFVDGSIIGMPARDGYAGPALFVSGPDAPEVGSLEAFGLQVRVLEKPIGAASALKMAYGGITKGLIAIGSAMILAAQEAGVADVLRDEMARSQAGLLAGFSKSIPDMFSKAGRWVAEMEEISAFVEQGAPSDIYRAFAGLYGGLAQPERRADLDKLSAFFQDDASA
jgi:3-hydroxyisobutyrate dehydrogenase-like beta-hydroxyacid dehydrogenase